MHTYVQGSTSCVLQLRSYLEMHKVSKGSHDGHSGSTCFIAGSTCPAMASCEHQGVCKIVDVLACAGKVREL